MFDNFFVCRGDLFRMGGIGAAGEGFKLAAQICDPSRLSGGEIVRLSRIGGEIVQRLDRIFAQNQFVIALHDRPPRFQQIEPLDQCGRVLLNHAQEHVRREGFAEGDPMFGIAVAFQQRQQGQIIHFDARRFQQGVIQAAGGNVGVDGAPVRNLRMPDDQRHMHQFLMHIKGVPEQIVFAVTFAVISRDHYQCVTQTTACFQ